MIYHIFILPFAVNSAKKKINEEALNIIYGTDY